MASGCEKYGGIPYFSCPAESHRFPSARLLPACAKGTSQIAQRMSLSVRIIFSSVQFGTSLLHMPNAWVVAFSGARPAAPLCQTRFACAQCRRTPHRSSIRGLQRAARVAPLTRVKALSLAASLHRGRFPVQANCTEKRADRCAKGTFQIAQRNRG